MIEKKFRWVKIADNKKSLCFPANNILQIEVEEKKICIASTVSGLKGCTTKCPHAGGDLAEGKLDKKGNIVCPVHGYIFNFSTGRDTSFEGYFLKTYPIKEAVDGVFIGIEERVFER
jgi:3-phenylpropionate/trans-cinnamate dioxygenase ferredoxin subunit